MSTYIVSGNGIINLYADGKRFAIPKTHPNYKAIQEGLDTLDDAALVLLTDIPLAVENFVANSSHKAEVKYGQVYFDGTPLHNNMTDRILQQMAEGFSSVPMLRFLENLMNNPSARAVNESYDFLAHAGLPITEDGHFLAYKGVRSDFKDQYSGKFDNSPGQKHEMPRNAVDDERDRTCSYGFHVGTLEYARNYCSANLMLVKVNPADVVSIPSDHDAQKCRVCKYEVLSVYEDQSPIQSSVYVDPNGDYESVDDDYSDDDDYDDYDSYDESDDYDNYYGPSY